MEDSDQQSPIPIPKGTYNFNFDDFDENTNPFQTQTKIKNSPPKEIANPFQTNFKLSSSPPESNNNVYEAEDPFKSKNKLSSTPPESEFHSGKETSRSPADGASDESPVYETEQPTQGLGIEETTAQPASNVDTAQDNSPVVKKVEKKSPSKKPTTKKSGIKKPKTRSKFKPPENFGVQNDDIQIFGEPPLPVETTESDKPVETEPPPSEVDKPSQGVTSSVPDDITNVPESVDSIPNEITDDITSTSSMPHDITAPLSMPLPGLTSDSHMAQSLEMMHDFGAGEMPDSEENEGFVPANEVFADTADWEMLEKFGSSGTNKDGRPSLLKKFDPLVGNGDSSVGPDISCVRNEQFEDTSRSEDLLLMNTPPPNKSSRVPKHPAARVLEEHVEENGNPNSGPRQVDRMLGLSPGKTDENKPQNPNSTDDNDADLKYYDAYDFPPSSRDRCWGPKNDSVGSRMENQDSIVQLVQVLKYSQSDWNKMKQDLELEFQAKLLNKEKEWSRKLADRDKNLSQLEEQSKSLKQSNQNMRSVVVEFEKTIAQLQAEKEKSSTESQQSLEDIVKERDQAVEDLQSVEMAFSDLHRRYEKTKGVVEGFKKNEEVLKKCVQDYQGKLKKAEEKMISVKQQAEEKLDMANAEIEKTRRTTTADIARLEAALRKSEVRVQGLENSLDQKVRENEELTAICDELIAKVGSD